MAAATVDLEIERGTNFGPVVITCTNEGVPVPLAGYSAFAHVRKGPGSPLILNLSPVIEADDTEGIITLPEIDNALTDDIPPMDAKWDLIIRNAAGKKLPTIIRGRISINQPITEP